MKGLGSDMLIWLGCTNRCAHVLIVTIDSIDVVLGNNISHFKVQHSTHLNDPHKLTNWSLYIPWQRWEGMIETLNTLV